MSGLMSRTFSEFGRSFAQTLAALILSGAPVLSADSPPLALPAVTRFGPITVAAGETLAPAPGTRLTIYGPETGPAVILLDGAVLRDLWVFGGDSSPLGAAVLVRGSGTRIERCAISGGVGEGVLGLRGSVTVTSCLIAASRIGISARASSVTVESCVIAGNAGPGVDLEEGARGAISASVISGNGAEGIRIGALASVAVESSAILGNRGSAWRSLFSGTQPRLRGVLLDTGLHSSPNAARSETPPPPELTPLFRAEPVFRTSEALMPLLDEIDFREADLKISTERMPFAPPAVKCALDSPLRLPETLQAAAERYLAETRPQGLLRAFAGALDSSLSAAKLPVVDSPLAIDDALARATALCEALPDAAGLAEALWVDEPNVTLLEEHFEEPERRRESARLGARAAAFDMRPLTSAAAAFVEAAIVEARDVAEFRVLRQMSVPPFPCTGALRAAWPTAKGWIIVGDSGPNEFGSEAAAIIDLGGDDVYHDAANADSSARLVLDLAGDDRYLGRTAAARRGCAILIDVAGDDRYEGGDFTLGAVEGGVALLWDEAGNDQYRSARATQGFAIAGLAALVDRNGEDEYTAASYGQAASGPAGGGLLVDAGGRDRYTLTGGASDILRDPSQRLSFGQGFSTGYRPGSAGGVALLIDGGGDDIYSADLFAQGVGYWGALAAIVDIGGNDAYGAWRYAQGAGVHLAYGAVIDRAGRDLYQAYSVAQGCGHDLAVGLLLDEGGNDVYRSNNLSQGVGNSNGTGVLLDRGGEDAYILEGHSLGQGWGVMENVLRRYGSLGFLLDLGSHRDVYTEAGRDGTTWRQGELGIGVDK
jgi:hypothetical protein